MGVKLGPLFDKPLHEAAWCNYGQLRGSPGCPRYDYRVTNSFYGRDLVNGGYHRATDVGNANINEKVLAPASVMARGLYHFDSARGLEFDLEGGWRLILWHLNRTLPVSITRGKSSVGPWQAVDRGEVVGLTGNTGGRLADGSEMPAHTHIVLEKNGVPIDAEPYLLIPKELEGAAELGRYRDVKSTNKFVNDIEWLAEKDITHGVGDGNFAPEGVVTRQQMAAFLHRFYNLIDKEFRRR